jgi:hypothetical protein
MSSHLPSSRLLAYLDGELGRREKRQVERHLKTCWTCRTEMHRLEDDIRMILDAHEKVFTRALPPPKNIWPSFDTLLAKRSPSWRDRFFSALSSLRRPLRTLAIPCMVVTVLVVALVLNQVAPVSAQEAMRRAERAQATQVISEEQVVRQRVHVRRLVHREKREDTQVAELEAWRSHAAIYWDARSKDSAAAGLEAIYRVHNVPVGLPLAMASIERWSSITGGTPTLVRRGEDFGITFAGNSTTIERVNFVVRSKDWLVKQLTLDFADVSFEISEEDTTVLPLRAAPRPLFAGLALRPSEGIDLSPRARLSQVPPPLPMADLNGAVLDVYLTLHRLQADLGEPVTVVRGAQGVEVGVWQLPVARRLQIARELRTIKGVNVQDDAPAASVRSKRRVTLVKVASASSGFPAAASADPDPGWREFFSQQGDEEKYTRRALSLSTAILAHLYALHNLQEQFPSEREMRLTHEQQGKLGSLLSDHISAAGGGLGELKAHIDPLAAVFHSPDLASPECSPGDQWQIPAIEALDTAKVLDHLLHRLLATGESPLAPGTGLPQIQQQLSQLSFEIECLHAASH